MRDRKTMEDNERQYAGDDDGIGQDEEPSELETVNI